MNLGYGEKHERLRAELREFLQGWPLGGAESTLPRAEQEALFRQRGIERGYVYREFPKEARPNEGPIPVGKRPRCDVRAGS